MAQTLEHNNAVTQVTPVTIQGCDVDTEIIQALDDEPNDVGGLSAQELKEKFDHVGGELKAYINGELIPAVLAGEMTEQARQAAEAERVTNEIERVSNETARIAEETVRAMAETGREAAETARMSAEAERVLAEQQRADENAGIVAQAKAQADAAEERAAEAAASALSAATAKQEAEAAAYAADGKATEAGKFAERAEASAAAAAGDAAQIAEDTEQSRENAQRAEEAAQTAQWWAEQTQAVVEGDFATHPELDQVQETADLALKLAQSAQLLIYVEPSQNGALIYNGKEQSPVWVGYNQEQMELSGVTEGVAAGTYEAVFTPKGDFMWVDGTQDPKLVSWTIERAVVAVPAQSGSLTYTGAAQSPNWEGYDAAKLTIGGTTSGIDAGTYAATFTPTANYKWEDGTTTAKAVNWTIGKTAGSLSLDKTSMALNVGTMSGTITVTRAGDGAISAVSSNTAVATVSVSGNIVTVTMAGSGSAVITVSVGAGTNHAAPENKTCSVTVTAPSQTLNSNTWAVIRQVSDANQGANYWAVGSTKTITINGTVRGFNFTNVSISVFILGFNHNSSREGNNRIHFQIGKIGTTAVALCDSYYGTNKNSYSGGFRMSSGNVNDGGWNNTTMRRSVLGNIGTPTNPVEESLLAALPSDLRAVMKSIVKYTDNTGGNYNTASYVTATTDYLFLLAEFEVFGVREYANSAEQNYQLQYDYYKAGNSRVAYNHTNAAAVANWWLRSPDHSWNVGFCYVYVSGSIGRLNSDYSYGVRPGFCV